MMTTTNNPAIAIPAMRRALVAMALALTAHAPDAWAQEKAQDADLTRPISTVEAGALNVGDKSFKAGEYNGLQKKGGLGLANFDLKGGARYDSDSGRRWRATGVDLGLEGRSLSAEIGVQGKSRFTASYRELLKNRSDSFQTIFDGAGGTRLTLPKSWLLPNIAGATAANSAVNVTSARGLVKALATRPYIDINTASPTLGGVVNPNANQLATVNAAADTGLPFFRNVDLSTKRTRVDLAFDYKFDPKWGVSASYRPEHRDGSKPMGVISRATGGDISVMVPDPIDTNTHLTDASMQFKGTKGFAQVGYAGAYFRNNVESFSFQNWALGPASPTTDLVVSSTPNTNFNQLNFNGAYRKSSVTTFSANGSVGRSTQNDRMLIDASTPVVSINTANARVVTTAVNGRVTTRLSRMIHAGASYKYDNRDNQTPVALIQFMDLNQPQVISATFPAGPNNPLGPVLATNAGATRSYDRQMHQVDGDIDFKFAPWQSLRGNYEFQRTNRGCSGSWITCANRDVTNENTVRADWRASIREDLVGRLGYAYSSRGGTPYNENSFLALVPYANVSPVGAIGGATYYSYLRDNKLNGWGPNLPFEATTGNANVFFPANSETHLAVYAWENRISELPGLRRYDVADRDRNKFRSSLDWQATETLSLRLGGDLDKSEYPDSRYGLTDASNHAVNADATYSFVDSQVDVNVFYTYEDLRSGSAGNTFTVNSNATAVNGVSGLSGNSSCNTFTTLQQRNNNAKLDPCLNWTTARKDIVHTLGFATTKTVGSLDVMGDLTFSRARSDNNVTGGNYVNNPLTGPGAPPTTIAAFYIPATPLPTVKTDSADLRLRGRYAIGPRMSLLVGYSYQRMRSDDYMYEGLTVGEGTIVNVFPSNEKPFNYGVHSFGVSYVYGF